MEKKLTGNSIVIINTGIDKKTNFEIISLKRNIDKLFKDNESDQAVIQIFNVIDNLHFLDSTKYELLFKLFLGKIYNEDIYIALLSATINAKENNFRKMYFDFVKKELMNIYEEKEAIKILIGL